MTNLQSLSKEEREALKISYAEASRHSEISLLRALHTIDELESRQKKLVEALRMMLKSAHPHPKEHPTMTEAWIHATAALREIGEGDDG